MRGGERETFRIRSLPIAFADKTPILKCKIIDAIREKQPMIAGIDYGIVIAYFVGILLLGIYFRKYVRTSKDYFLGGKLMPFWAIGMSLVVSDIGAVDFVGAAGQAYRYGVVIANFDWIGCIPAMVLAAFVFVPYYWKSGVYTIPEYLGRRYNEIVRTAEALIWILFQAFGLGIIFWASAILLNTLMGWPKGISIIITASITGIYTIFGGLAAVIMTDVVQMIIMYIGAAAILILGLIDVGGWSGLVQKVTAMGPEYHNHFNLILPADTPTPYPWTGILFGLTFVLANAYWIGNQTIVQRCLGAKDEWHAKASMLWGAFLKLFIPILVMFPGLIAIVIHPGLEDGDKAVPMLIRDILPPGLTGLLFAAFFAGLMSSVDSSLNSTATLWTKDIYERFIKKEAGDRHYLFMGRIFTFVILIIGVLTAPLSDKFPGMYVYVQTLLSFFQGPTLAILLLGMFWSRTTQWGGLFGLLVGICVSAYLYAFKGSFFSIQDPFLYISWWSFLAAVVVTVGVSLFTKPMAREKLYGLVYRLEERDAASQAMLKNRLNR
ncbi:MAG: sodium transporter [Calditrichaeota bacterium]|nr:MAG: sodium transporter [Calditrichota bacterium]